MQTKQKVFSYELRRWLDGDSPKTLLALSKNFPEQSFAILFLVLMSVPALPLPTGGVTHIFELINLLIAAELLFGRRSIWLPHSWQSKKINVRLLKSAIHYLEIIEKISKPRLGGWLQHRVSRQATGLVVMVFTLFAFFAPPFSGLDTLPSIGVVLIALAVVFNDILLFLLGLFVGWVGMLLVILLGTFVFKLL